MEAPAGFFYRSNLIGVEEESALLGEIERLPFREFEMQGRTARRTVVHYGWVYGYESWTIERGPPLPEFLHPLRARAAMLIDVAPEELEEILVTRYPAGAGIGWHRDAPMFGPVVAVSLGSPAVLALRRSGVKTTPRRAAFSQVLEPRSVYVLTGEARTRWQHTLRPTRALRWSVTFRTVVARRDMIGAEDR